MAGLNKRVDDFLRQNKEYVDTDEQGNPEGFEQSEQDGVVTFSFYNDGEKVTYEARPGQRVRPTLQYQGLQLKKGRRPETKKPGAPQAGPNGGPAERQKKPPAEPSQPTQGGVTQPSQVNQVETDDKPTYFEQYIRLARHLVEG